MDGTSRSTKKSVWISSIFRTWYVPYPEGDIVTVLFGTGNVTPLSSSAVEDLGVDWLGLARCKKYEIALTNKKI